MKAKEVIRQLEADGWVMVRQESSHRHFKKDGIDFLITISKKERDDLTPGELQDARRKSLLPLR